MTTSGYKRYSRFITRNYANVAATLALVIALTGATAVAAGVIVTSKQIKNGTILSQDIRNNDIRSSDIENGEVKPADVTMPEPEEVTETPAQAGSVQVGADFALVDMVGTYTKEDPSSALEVDWSGTVQTDSSPCIFQIRVDGNASTASGAGELFVANGELTAVSDSALFDGLGAGPVRIEVWARAINSTSGFTFACTVGPPVAVVSQNFVVSEHVS